MAGRRGRGLGVPLKVLHEADGHTVTVELRSGDVFRGHLSESEDTWNVHLENVTVTLRDGQVSTMQQVFLRGTHIRYIILPDMLKNAPMFQALQKKGQRDRSDAAILRGRARTGASAGHMARVTRNAQV